MLKRCSDNLKWRRLDRKKIFRFIFVGGLVSLSIVVGILVYEINQLTKYFPIASLDFAQNNNFIKINSAKIYGEGTNIISPNDEIILSLNMTNKQNTTVNVEPKILIYVGGDLRKSSSTLNIFLAPNEKGAVFPSTFYAADEGIDQVYVSLKISSKDGTFIQYYNDSTTIQVLTTGELLQEAQNNYVLLGVLASAATAIGAMVFTYWQIKESKEALIEQRKVSYVDLLNDIDNDLTDRMDKLSHAGSTDEAVGYSTDLLNVLDRMAHLYHKGTVELDTLNFFHEMFSYGLALENWFIENQVMNQDEVILGWRDFNEWCGRHGVIAVSRDELPQQLLDFHG